MGAEKVSPDELAAVQALYHELQLVQAKLQGAMGVLAAIYKLPDGSQIDPTTGVITRPEQKAEAE